MAPRCPWGVYMKIELLAFPKNGTAGKQKPDSRCLPDVECKTCFFFSGNLHSSLEHIPKGDMLVLREPDKCEPKKTTVKSNKSFKPKCYLRGRGAEENCNFS